jgi:hypothetical protein
MSRLNDLKTRLSNSADVAEAIGQLAEFISIVTLGLTTTGGVVTIPYIVKESSKTTASLAKLIKVLLGEEEDKLLKMPPAERADEIFYVFAQRAYLKAIGNFLIKISAKHAFKTEQHHKLVKKIENSVVKPDSAEASFTFGWNPGSGPVQLFKSYNEWLRILLAPMGIKEEEVDKLLTSIEIDARKTLHSDLISKEKDRLWMVEYQLLETTSDIREMLHGFFEEKRIADDSIWKHYLEEIEKKPSLPIWGEEEHGLGIGSIFVEPSYSYARSLISGRAVQGNPELSIPLKRFLLGLLSGRRPSAELIFVMGGPGTGKTSLMEVFGSEIAQTEAINFILVPAKKLNPNRSILTEVQNYLKDLGHESLADVITSTKDVIIAIDGFDELAHATLSTLETFFRQAQDLVRERSASRLRIIMSGRPTLFSTNDVSIPSGSHIVTIHHFDPDRVKEWSSKWRIATNGTFEGSVYLSSSSEDLRELATQPMLLYLLAKMHEENEGIPTNIIEEGGVRYKIYCKILDWVCRRQEDKKVPTPLTASLRRFLQVAGLATHQSGQRTLHWSNFIRALERSGLADDASKINAKVHSTILSFAFTSLEERSWEFTHKSFGEALAAEAIGRVLEDISEPGRDGERWKIPLQVASKLWVETFGPYHLSKDILDFYDGWLFAHVNIISSNLIPRMIEVFNHLLAHASSDVIANIGKEYEKSIVIVTGNAVRCWFNLTNMALSHSVRLEGEASLTNYMSSIQFDKYRTGVYLTQIVSPISVGEGTSLFSLTSRLVDDIRNLNSVEYMNNLIKLKTSFEFTNKERAILRTSIYENEINFISKKMENYPTFDNEKLFYSEINLPVRGNAFIKYISEAKGKNFYNKNYEISSFERCFLDVETIIKNIYEMSIFEQIRKRTGLTNLNNINSKNFRKIINTIDQMLNEVRELNLVSDSGGL